MALFITRYTRVSSCPSKAAASSAPPCGTEFPISCKSTPQMELMRIYSRQSTCSRGNSKQRMGWVTKTWKLHITSDEGINGAYMTLSHCWSLSQSLRLTASTLESMESGLEMSCLPTTFRDAILVARALKIRYLWTDSLCILQDSFQDWSRESSMMGLVYANSCCNIAATWGSNSNDGLFVERDPHIVEHCVIPNLLDKYSVPHVLFDPLIVTRQIEDAPLNSQGWVLQERLISPRVLHFGAEQVFWDCQSCVASEAFQSFIHLSWF
jgi:hypothetical protein